MGISEEIRDLAAAVSNWGRWGDDDERGTANLIDAAAVLRGVGCVREGRVYSLALDLRRDGVQVGQPATRYNPILSPTVLNERDRHAPGVFSSTDDLLTMSTCAATHVDTFAHVGYDERLYGDRPMSRNTAQEGATWCGASTIRPIVTRGILVDVPRVVGVDRLEAGHAVTPDQLQAAVDAGGLEVAAGDVVLVRTGDVRHYLEGDRRRYATGEGWKLPGLHPDCARWFHDADVGGVFIDTYAQEVFPPPTGNWDDLLAVHMIHLRDMGLLQGQNWDFEGLAAACAEDGRVDCLLIAAPEPIVGATSAPVHPVAVR